MGLACVKAQHPSLDISEANDMHDSLSPTPKIEHLSEDTTAASSKPDISPEHQQPIEKFSENSKVINPTSVNLEAIGHPLFQSTSGVKLEQIILDQQSADGQLEPKETSPKHRIALLINSDHVEGSHLEHSQKDHYVSPKIEVTEETRSVHDHNYKSSTAAEIPEIAPIEGRIDFDIQETRSVQDRNYESSTAAEIPEIAPIEGRIDSSIDHPEQVEEMIIEAEDTVADSRTQDIEYSSNANKGSEIEGFKSSMTMQDIDEGQQLEHESKDMVGPGQESVENELRSPIAAGFAALDGLKMDLSDSMKLRTLRSGSKKNKKAKNRRKRIRAKQFASD